MPTPAGLAVLAAAAVAAYLASRVGVPLAWVLGALAVTAAGSIAGVRVVAPTNGRRLGQLLVGSNIGLNMSAEAMSLIVQWLPAMLATAVVAVGAAAILSVPFARAARIDSITAFFSLTPGGLSEMANIGHSEGAKAEPIALSQAIRVALLVCTMPPLIIALGFDGGIAASAASRATLSFPDVAITLAACLGCVGLVRLARLNNAWMIGALLGSSIVATTGLIEGHMPAMLFAFGQFLIGIAIGARFRRENLMRLPRVCVAVTLFIVVLTVVLLAYAACLSFATGIDLSSAALASSPGGLAEMSLTAQVLHLNVALVTSFHIVRSFFVNGLTLHIFRLLRHIGLFRGLEALLDRLSGRR